MKRKTKNIHRFIIPKTAGGHYDIKTKLIAGTRFERYVPSQRLSRVLGRIYDMNYNKIHTADEKLGKEQFKNKILALMKEGKRIVNEETGVVSYKDRTLNEALRIMSKSTIFTSREELGLENIRKNIARGTQVELRTEIAMNWGEPYLYRKVHKDGTITEMTINRIPWKKIVWDEKTQSYRLMQNGKLSESGLKFIQKKRGKYDRTAIFEFVDKV